MGLATSPRPFPDVSLDVDTGRQGKVKRSRGDKVRLSWLPGDSRVYRHTWGWAWGGWPSFQEGGGFRGSVVSRKVGGNSPEG